MERVVVTGIGVIAPTGTNVKDFWENCMNGKSAITNYSEAGRLGLDSKVIACIKGDDFQKHMDEEALRRMGRPAAMALYGTRMALRDAGILSMDRDDTGVCIATAIADSPFCEQQFTSVKDVYAGLEQWDAAVVDTSFFRKGSFSDISTSVANEYDLHGPVMTISTGCVSGLDAIGYSYDAIRMGKAGGMICGSAEAPITDLTMASFDIISALSTHNEIPSKASLPFDKRRNGFVLSEGAGILILENYHQAKERKAHIYGEIIGYGSRNNAVHMTALPADASPLAKTIHDSINEAGITPDDIDFISAHGSGTPQNDIFETNAYKDVFGERAYQIPISGNKAIMGHPLGAASAIEFVRACLVLEHGIIPPTANLEEEDPLCDLDYVPLCKRKQRVKHLLINANGFSGIHSSIVLRNLKEFRNG